MIVLLIILVSLGILALAIMETIILYDAGTPILDKDISDYLDKIEKENLINGISKRWNDKFVLDITGWPNPSIYETQYSILFPYHIPEVGVIPIWSKSYSRVKKLFKDDIENSSYKTNKRKKLGLD
jgi:hypothetical protein